MSCTVFVHIKYSKELEEKVKNIEGIVPDFGKHTPETLTVPEILFSQHKKEVDAHKWVKGENSYGHYPENRGKWEYQSHGFDIWINFEGDIVFIIPCHWNPDHGDQTIVDIKEWIKKELGDFAIKEAKVSY